MSSHRHAFNIGLNVGGMVLPMLVGVLTVPGLLQRLGQEKFGVLALGWALVGYFGFLDLGMVRALTSPSSSPACALAKNSTKNCLLATILFPLHTHASCARGRNFCHGKLCTPCCALCTMLRRANRH